MLGVNLTGVMHCLRAQLPHLKEGGSIANAASILDLRGAKSTRLTLRRNTGSLALRDALLKKLGEET